MRMLMLWVASFFLIATPTGLMANDNHAERVKAAERYMLVMPLSELLDNLIHELAQRYPVDEREHFTRFIKEGIRIEKLELLTKEALVAVFSTQELNALADFYGSKEGVSAMKKFGIYTARIMPLVQEEIRYSLANTIKRRLPSEAGVSDSSHDP